MGTGTMRGERIRHGAERCRVLLHGHRHNAGPGRPEGVQRPHEGGLFHDHSIPRIHHQTSEQIDDLLSAAGDHQPVRLPACAVFAFHPVLEELPQRTIALADSILKQGRRSLLRKQILCHLFHFLQREGLRRRVARRKGDHSGGRCHFQHIAAGRRSHVLKSIQKMKFHFSFPPWGNVPQAYKVILTHGSLWDKSFGDFTGIIPPFLQKIKASFQYLF